MQKKKIFFKIIRIRLDRVQKINLFKNYSYPEKPRAKIVLFNNDSNLIGPCTIKSFQKQLHMTANCI